MGEVRGRNPSLTSNLGSIFLKVARSTTNGRLSGLLARTGSLSGHPSKPAVTLDVFLRTAITAKLHHWPAIQKCVVIIA
ncbi:hypothetical protein J6590_092588 [Homalodisca vitripennis]|nr:hypothetical protein J6590_092588 [Homalodisca vitripennis]